VYNNAVAQATFLEPSSRLSIGSRVLLQHYDDQPLNFLVADYAVYFPFQYDATERVDLGPYLSVIFDQDRPMLGSWLRQFWYSGQVVETYLLLEWINKAIATGFTYQEREEPGVQTPAITLTRRAGSCRDFATLFIEGLPFFGFSGALCQRLSFLAHAPDGSGCNPRLAHKKFIDALKALPDPRDNRGKRHLLTIFNSHCHFCHLGWPIKHVRYSSLHDP